MSWTYWVITINPTYFIFSNMTTRKLKVMYGLNLLLNYIFVGQHSIENKQFHPVLELIIGISEEEFPYLY